MADCNENRTRWRMERKGGGEKSKRHEGKDQREMHIELETVSELIKKIQKVSLFKCRHKVKAK